MRTVTGGAFCLHSILSLEWGICGSPFHGRVQKNHSLPHEGANSPANPLRLHDFDFFLDSQAA